MIHNSVFGFLIAIALAIIAVLKINFDNKKTRENFINVPLTYKAEMVSTPQGQSDFYAVPSNYQSMLAPRFSNLDYGAYIKYNMPSKRVQAVPTNPLGYGELVQENFTGCGSCKGGCRSPPDCARGGVSGNAAMAMQFGQDANPSYAANMASLDRKEVINMLPIRDMKSKGLSALSNGQANPIIYDRFVYANQRSRLRNLGDPIRGDIPITPNPPGWFRPSVHPNIDLMDGAMTVLGGINNQTSNRLHALQFMSSGGTDTTYGGVRDSLDIQGSRNPANDFNYTAFP